MIIHVVKPGDSIYSIAKQYGASWQKIVSDNELANPSQLVVGQTIVIMQENRQYTVKPGDTLYSIALQNQVRISDLLKANPQVTNPTALTVGQVITIPASGPKFGSIEVNG
ncbi:MAG: LysM peptidoglycan-binding domain-containing protein, partial [Clostridia bacterium]|nr:LysM peptidoglycan-binding domain-containing protein [Clostridia bacterium]